ncbi:hypothetical protein RJT34_24126 [Clitoria ternatea]|uniref:Uncharacterized protein n=1 Tax=Clitoria ternatea TaxID=43366 RepID=A0AAN9IH69_CLITE
MPFTSTLHAMTIDATWGSADHDQSLRASTSTSSAHAHVIEQGFTNLLLNTSSDHQSLSPDNGGESNNHHNSVTVHSLGHTKVPSPIYRSDLLKRADEIILWLLVRFEALLDRFCFPKGSGQWRKKKLLQNQPLLALNGVIFKNRVHIFLLFLSLPLLNHLTRLATPLLLPRVPSFSSLSAIEF